MKPIYYLFPLLVLLLACTPEKENNSWTAYFQGLGTNSSPRLTDLTGDGILDIVIGAGKNEWMKSDTAVIALNGKNGKLLWTVDAPNQVVGSACFLDVTGDGIQDVFIGGRSAFLAGINGKTGEVLWRYEPPKLANDKMQYAHFNFYNPQVIPDQTGDGIPDLLAPNGGNPRAAANSTYERFPGILLILDSTNGAIISGAITPDSLETYMSPLVCDFHHNGNLEVVFGTGGETIGGNLYRVPLADVRNGEITHAKKLASSPKHGFIAPPVLADITRDGVPDIVTNNQGGEMLAFDGNTDTILWSVKLEGTESSSSLAVGYFNNDDIPDFFGHFAVGVWPDNKGAVQVAVDGSNGHFIQKYELGCTGFFSPVAIDLNNDGIDEVLLSVNEYKCTGIFVTDIMHYLAVFDLKAGAVKPFTEKKKVKNLSSTPWLGDMDHDGLLDIVYCVQANTSKILEFYGMAVLRLETPDAIAKPATWGGYMGNEGAGVFGARE